MERFNAEHFWEDAHNYRETVRKRLLDEEHYRAKNTVSLLLYILRLLAIGFFVVPGVTVIGSVTLAAWASEGGLPAVFRNVYTNIAVARPVLPDAAVFQPAAETALTVWLTLGVIGVLYVLVVHAWRSPLSRRIDHAMDRWYDRHPVGKRMRGFL